MAKLLTQVAWGGGEHWTEDGNKRWSEDAASGTQYLVRRAREERGKERGSWIRWVRGSYSGRRLRLVVGSEPDRWASVLPIIERRKGKPSMPGVGGGRKG
uniref:Uncharacterized protein P0784G04.23 n=1 Tax=Oryza sativa subsp. japonica TaxID=39947 RepID=Q5F1V7_ORYSJ|nr:hypothetical protein [Oryza sativa Japonica Group]